MGFLVSLFHTFLASGTGRARIAGTETRVSSGPVSDCGPSHKPLSTGPLLVKNCEASVFGSAIPSARNRCGPFRQQTC